MFRKRTKKEYPPGTFIPTPARIVAILQLCLAFTLLAWHGSLPFMGELFSTKAKLLVYQHVMGKKIEGHATRFAELPKKQRDQILRDYDILQRRLEVGFMEKIGRAVEGIWHLPLFEKTWILFAVLIPILLLKRIDGAQQIVWILPVLALAYAAENRWQGKPHDLTLEEKLFPTEAVLLRDYLNEPLATTLAAQQQQLERGWKLYLVREWAKELPSDNFPQQVEKGDFVFNLARLEAIQKQPVIHTREQESYFWLALYIFWNLSFALVVRNFLRLEKPSPIIAFNNK